MEPVWIEPPAEARKSSVPPEAEIVVADKWAGLLARRVPPDNEMFPGTAPAASTVTVPLAMVTGPVPSALAAPRVKVGAVAPPPMVVPPP